MSVRRFRSEALLDLERDKNEKNMMQKKQQQPARTRKSKFRH